GAVEILVEVVAGRIVLDPAAPAEAEGLVLGQLLVGAGLARLGRLGGGGEAEAAERGHRPDHLQEVSATDPDGLEALGEEIHLFIRNPHGGPPVVTSAWGPARRGPRRRRR